MAPDQHQGHQGPRRGIDQRQQKQYHRGSDGNQRDDQDDEQDAEKRHLAVQIELLEAVITNVADHQQTDEDSQDECKEGNCRLIQLLADTVEPDQAGNGRRGRRTGQPLEVAFVGAAGLGIEPGQAQCRRGRVNKGSQPAQLAQTLQRPLIYHQGGSQPERHHIRQAVILDAEIGFRLRHPGDTAVHAVQDHRHEHGDGGRLITRIKCGNDRIEPGKQGRGREQVGQEVNAPAAFYHFGMDIWGQSKNSSNFLL